MFAPTSYETSGIIPMLAPTSCETSGILPVFASTSYETSQINPMPTTASYEKLGINPMLAPISWASCNTNIVFYHLISTICWLILDFFLHKLRQSRSKPDEPLIRRSRVYFTAYVAKTGNIKKIYHWWRLEYKFQLPNIRVNFYFLRIPKNPSFLHIQICPITNM